MTHVSRPGLEFLGYPPAYPYRVEPAAFMGTTMLPYLQDSRFQEPSAVARAVNVADRIAAGETPEEQELFWALQTLAWKSESTGDPEWKSRFTVVMDCIGRQYVYLVYFVSNRVRDRFRFLDIQDVVSSLSEKFAKVVMAFDPLSGFRFSTYYTNCAFKEGSREARKAFSRKMGVIEYSEIVEPHAIAYHGRPAFCEEDVEHLRAVMQRNSANLTKREQMVLYCRHYRGMTLMCTGEVVEVTKERVRQIEREALAKLRTVLQ